jgi:fumarate reductase subunit C
MSRDGVARRPYLRTMDSWWRRNPYFVRYMAREATAVAVAVYALVLAAGLVCLAQGEAAWNAWLAALRTLPAVALHVVLLVAMLVHAQSWFAIMPKTLPMIAFGGRRLPATAITRAGWAATLAASGALLAAAGWWRP